MLGRQGQEDRGFHWPGSLDSVVNSKSTSSLKQGVWLLMNYIGGHLATIPSAHTYTLTGIHTENSTGFEEEKL